MKYNVPMELLIAYIEQIKQMERLRTTPDLYFQADKLREQLHDQILKSVGVDRKNELFSSWLAGFVEFTLIEAA